MSGWYFKYTEYPNFEVIIVDNGSTEEHKKEIEAFILEYAKPEEEKIHYIYQPMTFNFSQMCNIGAAAAKGEYLLF